MVPGDLVTDHLRLVRKLGEGGMGSVWVADHLKLDTQVAVKFISLDLIGHEGVKVRFHREATSAAKIHSPHVVRVFDHGATAEGIPYIAMELLAGQDLGALIEERRALPVDFVRTVLVQACKGLGKAHELGIVHRDIKPENIFVSDEGGDPFVRLLDFGVAKQTLSNELGLTSSGTMMGTPYYMSPEQAMSAKQVDLRSDLWSLGVVTYHALTGTRPFEAETLGALCVKLDRAQFEPATRMCAGLPPALDAWFACALARKPEARFASAREMADAFSTVVGATASGQLWNVATVRDSAHDGRGVSGALAPDTMADAASVLQQSLKRQASPATWVIVAGAALLVGAALFLGLRGERAHVETAQSAQAPGSVMAATDTPRAAPPTTPVAAANAASASATAAATGAPIVLAAPESSVGREPIAVASSRGAAKPAHEPLKPVRVDADKPKPSVPAIHSASQPTAPATPIAPAVVRPTKKDRGF